MRKFSASSGKNPRSSKHLYWIESWGFLPLVKHLLISLLSEFNVVAGCLLGFLLECVQDVDGLLKLGDIKHAAIASTSASVGIAISLVRR